MKTIVRRKLGWLTDVPDARDVPFRAIFCVPGKVPERVDLRGGCSPVEDLGAQGSCRRSPWRVCWSILN